MLRRTEREGDLSHAGIESDARIPGLRRFTDMVHGHGSRSVVQLNHCGRQANPKVAGYDRTIAPSAVLEKTGLNRPRAMTPARSTARIEEFAAAAARAVAAGFDGVEVHMSHGYLLNQFLTPYTNRRTDSYGGSFENRLRLPREVMRAVRDRVGPGYPVIVKLNGDDLLMVKGGLSTDEFVRVALALQEDGMDAVEISCAHYESGLPMMPRALRRLHDDLRRPGTGSLPASWRQRMIAATNRPFAALGNRRWSAQEGLDPCRARGAGPVHQAGWPGADPRAIRPGDLEAAPGLRPVRERRPGQGAHRRRVGGQLRPVGRHPGSRTANRWLRELSCVSPLPIGPPA